MAVLIITNEKDLGADFVILELEHRGIPALRCNAERLPEWRATLEPGHQWELQDAHGRSATSEMTSGVWWRRPEPPVFNHSIREGEARALIDQWQAFAEGLASVPGPRWVSAPSAIRAAEDKALQLAAARRSGFAVPTTVWTNEIYTARRFASQTDAVVKTVTAAHWETDDEAAFVFATAVTVADLPADDDSSFAAAPVAFQTRIVGKRDIRATVVGREVLAAETTSQQVDWRVDRDAQWSRHALPREVERCCLTLLDDLGLRFAGIDLALDEHGKYWFLEVNPNGEWAWLERRGLPISAAIADILTRAH